MFSKFIKVKSCHPDKLYEVLLDRHFKESYHSLSKVVLHHTMTHRDGKIVVSLEFRFIDKIVFSNAHVFIDQDYGSINVFNIDKITEYMK
ncbi:hypothetical protein FDG95_gp151 [Pectobacterium phage vB_PcaM_CBB]|uniref:Uncharacterized protein n=1 Tax=Pectobacterium phage vB_PcaM_CBB TaxID=2772511 RepID=A0A1L2CUM6_9CAUD|nr:hypothetical protein FDG95_gp151 [Pectobacterium phage vB_PcaM_CBB]AMM43716.1 hypothetical protein CBB_151 [Pectobacterium phage vB_PcaM_CBB]